MEFFEFLYELLPPWLATAIGAALGLGAGIGGAAWHSHEEKQLVLCNSPAGEFVQVVNGAAHASCGASSLLSKLALVLEIGGFAVLGIFVIVFVVLAANGKLRRLESI